MWNNSTTSAIDSLVASSPTFQPQRITRCGDANTQTMPWLRGLGSDQGSGHRYCAALLLVCRLIVIIRQQCRLDQSWWRHGPNSKQLPSCNARAEHQGIPGRKGSFSRGTCRALRLASHLYRLYREAGTKRRVHWKLFQAPLESASRNSFAAKQLSRSFEQRQTNRNSATRRNSSKLSIALRRRSDNGSGRQSLHSGCLAYSGGLRIPTW